MFSNFYNIYKKTKCSLIFTIFPRTGMILRPFHSSTFATSKNFLLELILNCDREMSKYNIVDRRLHCYKSCINFKTWVNFEVTQRLGLQLYLT